MSSEQQTKLLLEYGDLLKISMAGLLKDFELETSDGKVKKGKQMFFGQQAAAYCLEPWENVNYASCHDGETLFDQVCKNSCIQFTGNPYLVFRSQRGES